MAKILQLRRGPESRLPILQDGEIIFTTDTHKLFVGTSSGPISIDSIDVNEYNIISDADLHFINEEAAKAKASADSAAHEKVLAQAAAQSAQESRDSILAAETKLSTIEEGAEVNVNADWNATEGDAQILNIPTTFPPSAHTHDYEPANANIQSHISATGNPHNTTYEEVGAAPASHATHMSPIVAAMIFGGE